MLKDYLFRDRATGEDFFVECETVDEAIRIALENFQYPKLIDTLSVAQAEMIGLDTY